VSPYDSWIGRRETRQDQLTQGLIDRFCATLDLPTGNDQIPAGLHWCLCLPDTPTSLLGADGHPERIADDDSFMPPIPLPRRMWASSRVDFLTPLLAESRIIRVSTIKSIKEKQGGTGRLFFVDVDHDTVCDDKLCIRETQSIVYREASTSAPTPLATAGYGLDLSAWDHVETTMPNETLLFRYSALTFNAHRIHYDLPYATTEEGYAGLVVHGPLTATLLLTLAGRIAGKRIASFSFRGQSPALCRERLHLAAKAEDDAIKLAALADDGRTIMSATASF
jgi:3-methylfumaryl-CoA hydratase